MIAKDWIKEAAIEIEDHGGGFEPTEWYEEVIARHCPFKPDVAYREVVHELFELDPQTGIVSFPEREGIQVKVLIDSIENLREKDTLHLTMPSGKTVSLRLADYKHEGEILGLKSEIERLTNKPPTEGDWRAVPNPMREDGAFLCCGHDRVYEGTNTPRLPETVYPVQLHPHVAATIAEAHNTVVNKLKSLLRESRREHKTSCLVYGNYQPPYEECTCGADAFNAKIDEVLK